jgi:MoaA/NifB/PqqE/SkfB family radical SAM enzyme
MKLADVFRAWGKVLSGSPPSLSIELTRECPLRCPGCYAYDDSHLGGGVTLRELNDFKGQALIDGVLEIADRIKPLHISLVGGDPLVRYREVETLVPQLQARGIHVQIVTSAFRTMPPEWASMQKLNLVVSIDGLAPEHDVRRAPATYERILKNIQNQQVTVHCTITGQMMKRPGYLDEFLAFWTPRPEIRKVWFSMFTPQVGDDLPEMLTREERARAVTEMLDLRRRYPKLDMGEGMVRMFNTPPASPEKCTFSQTTMTVSADLKTHITPCQFGGTPDCSSCGCVASMGLEALTSHWWGGVVPVGLIYRSSLRIGRAMAGRQRPSETGRRAGAGDLVQVAVRQADGD